VSPAVVVVFDYAAFFVAVFFASFASASFRAARRCRSVMPFFALRARATAIFLARAIQNFAVVVFVVFVFFVIVVSSCASGYLGAFVARIRTRAFTIACRSLRVEVVVRSFVRSFVQPVNMQTV
jgi:hypothetical protein